MNKKGFTLIELIVSIVLVGIVLASMIGTLMSLKETYTVLNDDIEARTYSALVSKTINDHIMKNNGIKGYTCVANRCEMILGSFDSNGQNKVMTLEITTSTVKTSPMKNKNTTIGSLIEKATTVKYYGEGYSYYKTIKHYDRHYNDSNKDVETGYKFENIEDHAYLYSGETEEDLKDYLVNITIMMNNPKYNIEIYSTSQVAKVESENLRLYTLTYNSNGGSTCPNNPKVGADRKPWGELCKPTKPNNGFEGWFIQQDGISIREVTASTIALEDITVYAHWDNNRYSCPAGEYLPAGSKTCAECLENNYCTGITDKLYDKFNDQGITKCRTEYYSPKGSSEKTACKITCPENTYLKTSEDTSCTNCPRGYQKGSHQVSEGQTSRCTLIDPSKPSISGGTTKIYGSADITLTCSTPSEYDNPASVYYSFGYSTTEGGTLGNYSTASNDNTLVISKTAYVGNRYYACRVYAGESGGNSTNVINSDTRTLVKIRNARITFNENGGTLNGNSQLYTKTGVATLYDGDISSNTATAPTASKTGHDFNGWFTANTGGSKILSSTNVIQSTNISGYIKNSKWTTTKDRTLYANLSPHEYTLTFDCNGGSGAPSPVTIAYGSKYTLTSSSCSTVKTGYVQDGWNTQSNGKGANWNTSNIVDWEWNLTDNLTIYAKWIDVTPPTVTFDPNSSSAYAKTANVTVTVTDNTSKVQKGQSIKYRWQTSSTCSTKASDYTKTAALSNASAAATSATATASASGLSGTYYLCVYSGIQDVSGNKTVITKSGAFKFDNTAPTAPTYTAKYHKGGATYTSGTWTNERVDFTISSSDEHSGIKSIQRSTNRTTWTNFSVTPTQVDNTTTYQLTTNWTVNERNDTYYLRAVDNMDNASDDSNTFTIRYDLAAPTISLSANSDSTYSKTKSVTVTLTDTGGSGLASGASVKYGWSKSKSTEPSSYTAATLSYTAGASSTTFTASGSGLTGEYYLWVVPTILKDVATNINDTTLKSTGTFIFDGTVPTVTFDPSNASSYATTASVTVTVSDSESGVKKNQSLKYRWQTSSTCSTKASDYTKTAALSNASAAATSATATANANGLSGTYYLCVYSGIEDVSGNTSAVTRSGAFKFDNTKPTAPTYIATYEDGNTYTSGTWTDKKVNFIMTSEDAQSGVKNFQHSKDGTNWTNFSASVTKVDDSTTYTLSTSWNLKDRNDTYYLRAVDNMGLASDGSNTFTIKYDCTAPTVSFNPSETSSYAKTASVTVTVADTGSGVKKGQSIKYRWQKSSTCSTKASDYTNTVALSNTSATASSANATLSASGLSGTYYLCVYSGIEDDVGKTSIITKSDAFKFDNTVPTAPTYTATYTDGSKYTSGTWTNKQVLFTMSSEDAQSGVKNFQHSKNGTSWTNFGAAVSRVENSTTYTMSTSWDLIEREDTYYLRAVDNMGLASDGSNTFTIKYDRTAPTVSFNPSEASSYAKLGSVTVTVADSKSGVKKGQSIKYRWQTSSTCSTTASDYTKTAALSNSSATAASATATASASGLSGGYYLCIYSGLEDALGNTSAIAKSGLYKIDNVAPTPTISGGTDAKKTSQSFNLSCTDGVGVTGYYWGTTEPTSNTSFTAVTSTTSWSGKTGSANSADTYWLGCKDASGNIGKTSVVVRKLIVYNMLLNISGTETSYNTSNYTQSSNPIYYVKTGTSFTQANMCSKPTGGNSLKGYNEAAPSGTTATIKTSNLTISTNKTISCWYNRATYSVTVSKPTGGTVTAATVTQTGNSVTASTAAATLTVRYGDKVKGTATASTGHSFSEWSGGYLSNSTNPSTGAVISAEKTITASFSANSYTLTYDVNGGKAWTSTTCTSPYSFASSGSKCTKSVTYNTAYGALPTPTKAGHSFEGWFTSASGGTEVTKDTKMGTSATIIYAHWKVLCDDKYEYKNNKCVANPASYSCIRNASVTYTCTKPAIKSVTDCTCMSQTAYDSVRQCNAKCTKGTCEGTLCTITSIKTCGTHANCSDACDAFGLKTMSGVCQTSYSCSEVGGSNCSVDTTLCCKTGQTSCSGWNGPYDPQYSCGSDSKCSGDNTHCCKSGQSSCTSPWSISSAVCPGTHGTYNSTTGNCEYTP